MILKQVTKVEMDENDISRCILYYLEKAMSFSGTVCKFSLDHENGKMKCLIEIYFEKTLESQSIFSATDMNDSSENSSVSEASNLDSSNELTFVTDQANDND